jgi:hypothetical protein
MTFDLIERASRLLAGSDPSAAPGPCAIIDKSDELADGKAWQTWSELFAGLRRVPVRVMKDQGLVEVRFWSKDKPDEDDFVEFHFEPGATDTNAWSVKCWKAGYTSSSRSVPSRTSHARATVAGMTRRFVVDHDTSIPGATALELTERAARLLAHPDVAVAPFPCHYPSQSYPDGKTWQTWSEAIVKWRRVDAFVDRLDGHRFMKNENGMVEVSFLARVDTVTFDFIKFKFEPADGGGDEWSLKCWDVSEALVLG